MRKKLPGSDVGAHMLALRRQGITDLTSATVVVTGASSGVGRATALAFAQQRANVVLAARDPGTLKEAAGDCEHAGGQALAVPTDVTDEDAVRELARQAVERFGSIEVWVNNAGVQLYGHFEKTPPDAFRRVVDTNLFGEIHGSRTALEQFRRQRRGVLINVASIWGRVTSPYVAAYVTSKFGVRAFTDCVRQGLADLEGAEGIHVCTILPEAIDTPDLSHAANYVGRQIRVAAPVAAPERVARAIVKCARHPRREVTVGWAGHLLELGDWLMPASVYSWVVPYLFDLTAITRKPAEITPGNLFEPMPEFNRIDGGLRKQPARRAARIAVAATLALTPPTAAAIWLRQR